MLQRATGTWTWRRGTRRACTTCARAPATWRAACAPCWATTPWPAPSRACSSSGATTCRSAVSTAYVIWRFLTHHIHYTPDTIHARYITHQIHYMPYTLRTRYITHQIHYKSDILDTRYITHQMHYTPDALQWQPLTGNHILHLY